MAKWIFAMLMLVAFIDQANSAVACGPRGCVAGRPGYYGGHRYYGGPYHRPGYGCAWVGGVRICR